MSRQRIAVIGFEHLAESLLCVLHAILLKVDRAQFEMRVGVIRLEIDRAKATPLGFVQLVQRAKGTGQVVPGAGVVGLEAHRAIQRIHGVLEFAQLKLQRAQIAPYLRLFRVQFQRAEIALQRGM